MMKAGVSVGEILEIGSREAIKEAVAAGLGVGIIAESELGDDLRLKALPFEGKPITSTEYVACLQERKASPLVKAFLEQVMRPGVAFAYEKTGIRKLLTGRSAHIVVTMGMPALAYRLFFLSHGVAGLRRNIFKFVGFSPVRSTLFGMVAAAPERTRDGWLARMRRDGERLR